MKVAELRQIIREELQNTLSDGLTKNVLDKYQNKTGPKGLVISKLNVLEKVLKQLKKTGNVDGDKVIDMVLKTFDEIREI